MAFKKRNLVLLMGIVLFTAGCKTQSILNTESDIDSSAQVVNGLLDQSRTAAPLHRQAVEISTESWLPSRSVSIEDPNRPGLVAEKQRIVINRTFHSIEDVAERITQMTGYPVMFDRSVNDDDDEDDLGNEGSYSNPEMAMDPMSTSEFAPPPILGLSGSLGNLDSYRVAYDGDLEGFLNSISSRYDIFWDWVGDGSKIRFFKTDTRTFRIMALVGNTNFSSSINHASETGSTHTSGVDFANGSVWDSLGDSINSMLSNVGRIAVTPSTGTITVTDNPLVLEKVSAFIADQNDALGKQVVVNVRVLSVETDSIDNYGINWDIAFQNISQTYGATFSTAFSPVESAANLGLRILSNSDRPSAGVNRWTGSEALISALSKQGKVSQMTSAAVTTLNNQPVPVKVGRQRAYLESSETTVSEGITTSSLVPGKIDTGFSMNLVPHIISDNELLLQFGAELSSLISLETFTSGESTIQVPETENRNFLQRVRMKSGETLVVAGFENSEQLTNSQGVGRASNTWAGGGASGSNKRNAIVVLIQPIIAE